MRQVDSASKSATQSVPWKTSDVAIGIALVVAGLVVLIIIYGATGADPQSGTGFAIIGVAADVILILASSIVGPLRYGVSLGSLGLRPPAFRGMLPLILPLVVLAASLIFAGLYGGLLEVMGWDNLKPEPVPEDIMLEGTAIIGSFVLVVIWGPLAEEVFFRGFVFSGVRPRTGVAVAVVASALLFALFHVDPRVMVPIFVTGALLAWLYHKTGSLWGCFVAHGLQNAIAFSVTTGTMEEVAYDILLRRPFL